MLKLGKNKSTNDKYTPEELASISLEAVKKLIEEQVPDAFATKAKKNVKKVTGKKTTKKLVKK